MCRMNDIGFDHQIFVDEFRRIGIVGVNPSNLGRGQIDLFNLPLLEKACTDR